MSVIWCKHCDMLVDTDYDVTHEEECAIEQEAVETQVTCNVTKVTVAHDLDVGYRRIIDGIGTMNASSISMCNSNKCKKPATIKIDKPKISASVITDSFLDKLAKLQNVNRFRR